MTAEEVVGQGKAGFDHVYNRADPREYFKAIRPLGYEIPQNAHAVFDALLTARGDTASTPRGTTSVLDVCCSYGVNAALLRCRLTLEDLFDRYGDSSLAGLTSEELVSADLPFYADHLRPDAPRILGLDTADRAIAYACRVGLLDAGWGEDLEADEPSEALAKEVGNVAMITVTGGVGYITERTFERLLGTFPTDRKPWVASFVLRMFPYDRIAETLAGHGLVTEQLAGTTFPQRRFESEDEQRSALRGVRARGIDTSGKEEDGWYHCDFYLSRPQAEVESLPLQDLLGS